MKNKIFIIGIAILGFNLYGSINSDRIDQKLTNAASKAFGSFIMFKNRIDSQGLYEWNAAIEEGENMVIAANKKNKKVQGYCKRINNANNELVNTIKLTFNTMFMPFLSQDKLSPQDMANNVNYQTQFTTIFLRIKDEMAKIKQEMKRAKLAEKDVIISLASYISNYADNAINSMEYWLSDSGSQFVIDIDTGGSRLRDWNILRNK